MRTVYINTMQQVLQLSQEMLSLAQQGEWDKVEALETEREGLLGQHGVLPADSDEASLAAGIIQQAFELNQQVLQLAKNQLNSYARERGDISKGRRAVAAYGG